MVRSTAGMKKLTDVLYESDPRVTVEITELEELGWNHQAQEEQPLYNVESYVNGQLFLAEYGVHYSFCSLILERTERYLEQYLFDKLASCTQKLPSH